MVTQSITIQGFIVFNLFSKYDQDFLATMPPKVASGQIKHRQDIYDGLDKVGEVLLLVMEGNNKAKAIVRVADDEPSASNWI